MLDSVVAAETPEGILLELRPAGLTRALLRLRHRLADPRSRSCYAAAFVAMLLGGLGWALLARSCLSCSSGSTRWCSSSAAPAPRPASAPWDSRSSWTMVCRSRRPPRSRATCCASRTSCPASSAFAIVSMLLRADSKRLGDIAAATLVVHQRAPGAEGHARHGRRRWRPCVPLSPRDQAAVIALAARAPTLTVERLDELAAMAAPVQGERASARTPRSRAACSASRNGCWDDAHDAAAFRESLPGRVGRTRIPAPLDPRPASTKQSDGLEPIRGERVAALYRRACEHLALARARSYPRYLLDRLDKLTSDAHQVIYQRREFGLRALKRVVRAAISRARCARTATYVWIADRRHSWCRCSSWAGSCTSARI